MIHSPETVKKLLNVLQTSDSYFEKTDLMREQVLTQAESIWKINSTIKDFLGLDLLKEIRNSPLAAFANFFLGMIGFS